MWTDPLRWRAMGPALALVLLAAPFLGRPHHIDDPLYLEAARQVARAPLDPLGGRSFWHDSETTLFHDLYNPPLTAYLLAPAVTLAGGSEVAVHGSMVAMAALALVVLASAGRRLGVDPRWTWLVACSPALLTSSTSAMADVPFLFLTLLSWRAALAGRGALAGVVAGASALAKYVGLLNVPVALLALPRHDGRSRAARSRAALLAGASLVFGAWCAWNLAAYGALHLREASRFQSFGWSRQPFFALHLVAGLGLAGLPAALGLLRWTRGAATAALLGGLVCSAAAAGSAAGPVASAGVGFLAGGAGAALLWSGVAALRSEREPFLGLAFAAYAVQAALLVYFGAVRYLLPLLPLLLFLLVRSGRLRSDASALRWAVSVGGSAALALAVGWADAGYAAAWRAAAERLPPATRGFQTGRWGFAGYAAGRGYRPLPPRELLVARDVVAEPLGIHTDGPTPAQRALLRRTGSVRVWSPALRLMDRAAAAGYYSSDWGPLPFGWRPRAFESVTLREPEPWVLRALRDTPVPDRVTVDVGSPEARHLQLDGWSGDETFDDAGERRRFAWAVGPEAALRVPVPEGTDVIALRAFPAAEAVGRLAITVEGEASAELRLQPGWHTYSARFGRPARGGVVTVVLRPAGHRRPGPFDAETRPLSLAVDTVRFGRSAGPRVGAEIESENRGCWPVLAGDGSPGMFVAGAELRLDAVEAGPIAFRVAGEGIEVRSDPAESPLVTWSAESCPAPQGCEVVPAVRPGQGVVVVTARRATVWGLRPAPTDARGGGARPGGPDGGAK